VTDEPLLLPEIDSEPDEWADEHPKPTDEEVRQGNLLGACIDAGDDEDAG
jgi:hypothetical protein